MLFASRYVGVEGRPESSVNCLVDTNQRAAEKAHIHGVIDGVAPVVPKQELSSHTSPAPPRLNPWAWKHR